MMGSFVRTCSKINACLIIGCLLLIGITGCDNPEKLQNTQDIVKPTTAPQIEPTEAAEEAVRVEAVSDIGLFKPIQHSFIKYDFNVKLNGTETEPISFFIEGKYDLDQDGKPENISIQTRGNLGRDKEIQTYIQVNGFKQEFYMDYSENGEVQLIDLDRNDKFIEAAIFDEGPSGDPHYTFYRFDGSRLYEIGQIDSNALINGEGKLISSFHVSRFTPSFYSAWFEISDNDFVEKINDIEGYLGKNYRFEGGEAYFVPVEEMPKDFEALWGEAKNFEASDIKVMDVYFPYPDYRILNFYFVEFPDGERGMMYFWIGD